MNVRLTLQTYIMWALLAAGLIVAFLAFKDQISTLIDHVQGQPSGGEKVTAIFVVPGNQGQEYCKQPKKDSKTGKRHGRKNHSSEQPTTSPGSVLGLPESPILPPSGTGAGTSTPAPNGGNSHSNAGAPSLPSPAPPAGPVIPPIDIPSLPPGIQGNPGLDGIIPPGLQNNPGHSR